MLLIYIIRTVIFITFLLLVVGEIAAFVWAIRFNTNYERRHKELEVRVEALERRSQLSGERDA